MSNTMLLSNTNEIHWQWAEKNSFAYKGHHAEDFFGKIYLSYGLVDPQDMLAGVRTQRAIRYAAILRLYAL